MARIRTIKPEFFTSLTIASLPISARLTFIGLWTHVDDEGRCVDDARLVKAAVWPLDDVTAADVEQDLKALDESSLITRYMLGERSYMAITNWREHQRIDRATKSKLPAPPEAMQLEETAAGTPPAGRQPAETGTIDEPSTSHRRALDESSTSPRFRNREQGTGNREQGTKNPPSPETGDTMNEAIKDAAEEDPLREDVERICRHLADRIEDNGSKRPKITQAWRTEARRLLDLDRRTVDQVIRCIDWCQNNTFWRKNVLSMPKLREQYDRLRLAAQDETDHRTKPGRTGPYRQPEVAEDEDWAAGL